MIVPIVFSFDNNMIMPACVCINSLLLHANKETFYDIFILHSSSVELRKSELQKLSTCFSNFRIQYRVVDDCFDNSYEVRGITAPTYYRLLIPEVIKEYDKIIYSDVDVIFRSDLSDMYLNTDLTDYYVAGVNSLSHLIPNIKTHYEKLLVDPYKTIYAGNLIINSAKLLKDNVVDLFRLHATKHYKYQDMDVLNIVCAGKIKYLSPDFCVTTYFSELANLHKDDLLNIWSNNEISEALKKGLIHYNGQKPWKGTCINFDVWWEYYRKSLYFDPLFYFAFFNRQLNLLDHLSLWKRIKILVRYFCAR